MAVDAAAAATGTASSATLTGKNRLADNFETFLTLLTTQLSNQDPLSPLDSNEFTAQLVQMSGVEQQLLTNDLLQSLVNTAGRGIADAVSLIGKDVRTVSNTTGLQKGEANWSYKLDRDAANVTVEVLDSTGKIVHAAEVEGTEGGEHTFTWDGKNLAGKQLADGGAYTLRVTAVDANGLAVPSTTFVDGLVSAVEQLDGDTWITVNGAKILWEKVTKIALRDEAANTNTPTDTTDGSDETDNTNTAA